MKKQTKHQLILEKEAGKIWGRVVINDNLIFDSASNLASLERKIRRAIKDFEGLEDVHFEYAYDMTIFFEQFNFLNQTKIAEWAGLNPGLVRQYSSGHKQPSQEQLGKIESALHSMAKQLLSVKLSTRSN